MSVEAHISQLETRHRKLDVELSQISSNPAVDEHELALLKRQKLRIKDEINRLKADQHA
ncbi:MAG: DUF465 domain-containing protein [Pseudomonadota bacterium]